ncbi:MAG TPA: non-homologous end-joining DNA ligase [Polyangia bacterium]
MDDVVISHPEKVLFPADGITKGELCGYYEAVAAVMVPHLRGRPVTMERYPAGIDKKGFIQKDVSKGFPEWLARVEIGKRAARPKGREGAGGADVVHYPLVEDARALLWMANQNSVTPHVWNARLPDLYRPDLCVFDLDPSSDEPEPLRVAALAVRALLAELGLPSWVKTSGSKGFHIVVPLDQVDEHELAWRFAQGVGAVLVKRHPELLTQEFIKADRAGRIFIDTGRNAPGATFAAAYAVRPKPGAPISAPCTWPEVERAAVGPQTFTLRTMAARLSEVGDLWGEMDGRGSSLRAPMSALERLLSEEDWREAHAAATRRPVSRRTKARAQKPG